MNVNITKTKEYYNSIEDSALCDCGYCRNYRLQVRSVFSNVTIYLDSLGIDIEKPFETSPLEPDENGMLEYCCCQYIVFGNCEPEYQDVSVIKTYEVTDSSLVEDYLDNDKLITMVKYYEMSDGTWKTDEHTYQYRLEITGRMNNAEKDSTYVFLSNVEDITFDQAWKASGLSSNMDDYFDVEGAKFVAMK